MLFLEQQDALDLGALLDQFGVGLPHRLPKGLDQRVEKGLARAELVSMTAGAAQDAAQHITATLIRGHDAVAHQEGAGADVIGDHAQRGAGEIGRAGGALRGLEQDAENIDLVVGMDMLHHRGDALEPHTGVHRGLGQGRQGAICRALILHEHDIPDLDVAVGVFIGAAGRTTRHIRAMVKENFGAGPTGAGVAHRPEVALLAEPRDAIGRHADLLDPDLLGFIVVVEYRDPELLARDCEHAGQELPGKVDRLALEVITEAEVAEHLEEGVVPRRVANVVEVVVLAASAHAALRTRRAGISALLAAEKKVLELDHAGVGEQQRGIVAGHQRTTGHAGVALAFEVSEKGLADLGAVHAEHLVKGGRSRPAWLRISPSIRGWRAQALPDKA